MRTLPLTLFEEYLFHENRRNYPCNIWIKAQLKGRVDRSRLESAIAGIPPKHPLLTARIESGWFNSLHWSLDPERKIPIHWHKDDPDTFRPHFGSFDLFRENGFEFHIVQGNDHWDLYINQSHAICDGAGTYRVLHDVLSHYNALSKPVDPIKERPQGPPPEYRSQYGLNVWKTLALIPSQLAGLLVAATLLRRNIDPLCPTAQFSLDDSFPSDSPHYVSKVLNKSEYFAFRKTARESSYSINDLCLAFFQSAIGKWRQQQGVESPQSWIRISVPVNLRSKADKSLSACNAISIVSIDRKASGLHDRKRLIRRAKEDMDSVKKGRFGYVFLIILWIRRKLPGGIRKMSHHDECRTTAVFTNVGSIFVHSPLRDAEGKLQAGGSRLERITSIAPYRPQTQATLLISVYASEFEMTLHYDSRVISKSQGQSLLDLFEQEIRQGI